MNTIVAENTTTSVSVRAGPGRRTGFAHLVSVGTTAALLWGLFAGSATANADITGGDVNVTADGQTIRIDFIGITSDHPRAGDRVLCHYAVDGEARRDVRVPNGGSQSVRDVRRHSFGEHRVGQLRCDDPGRSRVWGDRTVRIEPEEIEIPWPECPPGECPGPEGDPVPGPAVSSDPVLGGLVFHITDRSGVDSQCTLEADDYERSGIFLPASKQYDLKIVPALPKFDNWDVAVTCDNGASTRTSIFF